MAQFSVDEPIAVLYRNEIQPNAIEVAISNVVSLLSESSEVSFDDFLNLLFGYEDQMHMDNRDPESILNTLRTKHNALFCQFIEQIKSVTVVIFQKFAESDLRITIDEQIDAILDAFRMVFQHFYPEQFTSDEFIKKIEEIAFYKCDELVKQCANRLILTTASIFCTMEHQRKISAVIAPLQ